MIIDDNKINKMSQTHIDPVYTFVGIKSFIIECPYQYNGDPC